MKRSSPPWAQRTRRKHSDTTFAMNVENLSKYFLLQAWSHDSSALQFQQQVEMSICLSIYDICIYISNVVLDKEKYFLTFWQSIVRICRKLQYIIFHMVIQLLKSTALLFNSHSANRNWSYSGALVYGVHHPWILRITNIHKTSRPPNRMSPSIKLLFVFSKSHGGDHGKHEGGVVGKTDSN